MSTNDTLMDECRKEAPYKVIWLSEHRVPTYVIHGGPHHIASFWASKHEAERACEQLNAVHASALYAERSKPRTGLTVEDVMEVVEPLCIGEATSSSIRARLTAKLNNPNQ